MAFRSVTRSIVRPVAATPITPVRALSAVATSLQPGRVGVTRNHPLADQLYQPIKDAQGRYQISWKAPASFARPQTILQWQTSKDRASPGIPNDRRELDTTLPMETPEWIRGNLPSNHTANVTWIGHATALVQMGGLNIITDPVFSDAAGPWGVLGPRRYRPPAATINQLPGVDIAVISHNHYDHLDTDSVRAIAQRFNPKWYVPLGIKEWMIRVGHVNSDRIVELGWWQEHTHSDRSMVAFTPTQHWSRRTAFDLRKTLWGSFTVAVGKQRFFFTGDTGYCEVFDAIGRTYGPFDIAAIPIGAYNPESVMRFAHCGPEEAVRMHKELRSKKSFGIHWGTFVVTDEPYLEPRERLAIAAAEAKLEPSEFYAPVHGRTVTVPHASAPSTFDYVSLLL